MEQLIWRGLGACITRMAPTRSHDSRPSQREGYIPQSPKVRFLGTVHPFGEYLRRKRPNFRWELSCDETMVAFSEKCQNNCTLGKKLRLCLSGMYCCGRWAGERLATVFKDVIGG